MYSPKNQNCDGAVEADKATRLWRRSLALVVKFRTLIVALVAMTSLVAGYSALHLEFNAGTRIYFSAESPERKALDALEESHGNYATAVILIVPASGNAYDSQSLEVLRDLTAAAKTVKSVAQVASLTAFRPLRLIGGRSPGAPLLGPGETPDDAAVKRIRASVEQDRDRTRSLVSDAGDVTSVIVLIDQSARPLYDTLDDLGPIAGGIAQHPSGGRATHEWRCRHVSHLHGGDPARPHGARSGTGVSAGRLPGHLPAITPCRRRPAGGAVGQHNRDDGPGRLDWRGTQRCDQHDAHDSLGACGRHGHTCGYDLAAGPARDGRR